MPLFLLLVVLLSQASAQTDCSHIPNNHGEGFYNLGELIGYEYVDY